MRTSTARVLIDGTFYLRCEFDHVESVIDQLELDGIEIDDVTWSTDQLGRMTVSLTTASNDDDTVAS